MNECIFCKISSGSLPADKVYDDSQVLAFLDIAPVNPGHTLLIPRQHYGDLLETPAPIIISLVEVLPKIARAIVAAVEADGFNIGINNGAAAGQVVNHVHMHIIPRFIDDGYRAWGHRQYSAGEAIETARRVRTHLEMS